MVSFNFPKREMNVKIVYYGPALSGKTTNLESIHKTLPDTRRGQLLSLATQTDRTLFFDLLPLEFGEIEGFATRFHLYTVPGQVMYNTTRKKVLTGVDGVVFVADSQPHMMRENLQSLENLAENLASMGRNLDEIPLVIQYNKRDMPKVLSVDELNAQLNPRGLPSFEAVACSGEGVVTTLTRVSRLVVEGLRKSGQLPSQVRDAGSAPRARTEPANVPPAAVPRAAAPNATTLRAAAATAAPAAAAAARVSAPARAAETRPVGTGNVIAHPTRSMPQAAAEHAPAVRPPTVSFSAETSGAGIARCAIGEPDKDEDGSLVIPVRLMVEGVDSPLTLRLRLTVEK